MTTVTTAADVTTLDDLPAAFVVDGLQCVVAVQPLAGVGSDAPVLSHYVGYAEVPDGLDPQDLKDRVHAPYGITWVGRGCLGFDTGHAYQLNVDGDGDPLPHPVNLLEARHESDMTSRWGPQRVADATASLAREIAQQADL